MSSTDKTTNYQLSQFVGTDIPSILNDYNGDMRKIDSAIKEVSVTGGDNSSEIAELRSTVGAHTTEISGINSTINSLSGRVVGIESKIPANASAENKLITAEDIPAIPSIETLEEDVANIQSLIPATASAENKLATMADVESGEIEELEQSISNLRTDFNNFTRNYQYVVGDETPISNYSELASFVTSVVNNVKRLYSSFTPAKLVDVLRNIEFIVNYDETTNSDISYLKATNVFYWENDTSVIVNYEMPLIRDKGFYNTILHLELELDDLSNASHSLSSTSATFDNNLWSFVEKNLSASESTLPTTGMSIKAVCYYLNKR